MTSADASQDSVTIERTLDAPVSLVWQMWTDPDQFAAWYGPDASTIPFAQMDVRVGGRRHICIQVTTPAGSMQMWFTGEYRDVVENELLTYTESMSNENGDILDPSHLGMPPGYPTTTEVRIEFQDLGGTTRMIMTHYGVAADSPGATGWTMALDKLFTLVEARR